MGLVSFLAGRLQVLRVAPWHTQVLFNAAARANIQSATVTSTPLTDAGLNGTGEVIQVLDTGLDETSCYFEDGDGLEVVHGHFFEDLGFVDFASGSSSSVMTVLVFDDGDFSFDVDRRKIIQYINMVKPDSATSSSSPLPSTTTGGRFIYWVPGDSFEQDSAAGHGTHTAGSAAGATLTRPADPVTCSGAKRLSCVGGCIDDDSVYATDDLLTLHDQIYGTVDIDRICPMFGCDDATFEVCLGDDVSETLTDNGGMAQGAKLAIFDIFFEDGALAFYAGNGLWEACLDAGCKLHSNSYGSEELCTLSSMELVYDDFMYTNPENLLLFAAGNSGDVDDGRTVCTIGSPGLGKNILTVGASSSGETRVTLTAEDGTAADGTNGFADIDTVAVFSSYGPTQDGRIKPEIVAPGDMIYSAAGDGTDGHSCRLYAYLGTSMSCPIVAGAAAMIRQYFVDASFYATDVSARGFCDQSVLCEGFSPSSATVKALLINSANLMGGSSEPDGYRGFGRVHLEQGMPLGGEGSLALFVADAASTSIKGLTTQQFLFEVNGTAGLDFRVTLSWTDPAATSFSAKQLVHDLDLAVNSPSGIRYTMWASGDVDVANVNERVIVDALDVESGTWAVWVWAKSLTTDFQRYSLVVNGAITSVVAIGAGNPSSS
ncbi:unnamed protein product, partial [Laminaria digitata]